MWYKCSSKTLIYAYSDEICVILFYTKKIISIKFFINMLFQALEPPTCSGTWKLKPTNHWSLWNNGPLTGRRHTIKPYPRPNTAPHNPSV